MLIGIIREISKLIFFTLLWGFPLWLSKDTGNYHYLWFLILSVLFSVAMFTHYEDLERVDRFSELDKDKNNEQNV